MVFCLFSGVLDWIVLILVCFKRSLHSAQVRGQSCPWPLNLMMLQGVERMWIRMGGYRCLRGKWVKDKLFFSVTTGRIFVAIIFFVFVQPKYWSSCSTVKLYKTREGKKNHSIINNLVQHLSGMVFGLWHSSLDFYLGSDRDNSFFSQIFVNAFNKFGSLSCEYRFLTIFVFPGSLHVQFILWTFPYKQFLGTGYRPLPILVIPRS